MLRLRNALAVLAALLFPSFAVAQGTADLARRVADVASLAMDEYQLGFQGGRVTSPVEVQEARLFLEEAKRSAGRLPPRAVGPALALLDTLLSGVEAHQPVEQLRPRVDALRAHLASVLGVNLDPLPTQAPSLARGGALYAERCAACHGVVGRGDGPRAVGLTPPPADLTARALSASNPLDFYRKLNVGVAGTAMPSFSSQLSSDDRWAVALYSSGLRYTEGERASGERVLRETCRDCLIGVSGLSETAGVSDDSLALAVAGELRKAPDDSLVRDALAYARTAAAEEALGGDRSLRAARVVAETRRGVEAAVRAAEAGDRAGSAERLVDAYLVFERIEAALRARRPQSAATVERAFGELRTAAAGSPLEEVRAAATRLDRVLTVASDELAVAPSSRLLFAQSLLIMLREGFEAILVIGALVAFLVRSGAVERKREIGLGVLWAVGASLLTALAYATVFRNATASQEALEGVTMLVAAAVLFWVSYWLVSKTELKKWQAFVGARITLGIVVGFTGLGVVYYLMQRYGTRLPLKPFFAVTSGLLYLMAFSFVGQGISELQAAGYVPATPLSWIPTVPALGIFPTLQSFLFQGLLLAAVAAALVWVFWLEPKAR